MIQPNTFRQIIFPPKATPAQKEGMIRRYIGEAAYAMLGNQTAKAESSVPKAESRKQKAETPIEIRKSKIENPADLAVRVPFGKHQGMRLGDLLELDPRYVHWLAGPTCTLLEGRFAQAIHNLNLGATNARR